MCLIAYVPANKQMPETYFRAAAKDNSDGIGFMSADGVEKFLGRKMVKRAWRYARQLHDANVEYAVHFRWATHGRVALTNTHPFKTPDGNAYVMHNGILTDYTPEDKYGDESDTRRLVSVMVGVDVTADPDYWTKLADHIGWSNKLCVMSWDGQFRIVNEDAGDWIDGIWYSQTYSLPGVYSNTYETAYGATSAQATYQTGGYMSGGTSGRSYYLDASGKYHELGYGSGTNSNVLGYDPAATVRAALMRRAAREEEEATSANGAGTHSLPADTYTRGGVRYDRSYRDDRALDAELEKHFADLDSRGTGEPTDMCPSCESLYIRDPQDLAQCPECGFIDMSDGMLDAYQVAGK